MKATVKIIVLFILIINNATLISQNQIPIELYGECCNVDSLLDSQLGVCPNSSSLYYDNTLWIPKANDEIKYVDVNFIFLHNNNGEGSFVLENAEH